MPRCPKCAKGFDTFDVVIRHLHRVHDVIAKDSFPRLDELRKAEIKSMRDDRREWKSAPLALESFEAASVRPGSDQLHYSCNLCGDGFDRSKRTATSHFLTDHDIPESDTKHWVVVKDATKIRNGRARLCLFETYFPRAHNDAAADDDNPPMADIKIEADDDDGMESMIDSEDDIDIDMVHRSFDAKQQHAGDIIGEEAFDRGCEMSGEGHPYTWTPSEWSAWHAGVGERDKVASEEWSAWREEVCSSSSKGERIPPWRQPRTVHIAPASHDPMAKNKHTIDEWHLCICQ
jgi:hypothetical protein